MEKLHAEGEWPEGRLLVQVAGRADCGVQGEEIALAQLVATSAWGEDAAR